MNEEDNNPFQLAFLINFDLAIKEKQEGPSEAQGKTSTRVFIAIRVLFGKKYSFKYDLELFFQVLFQIYIYYNGLSKDISLIKFKRQNYKNTTKLVKLKLRLVNREGHFLNCIVKVFTLYYQPLVLWVNKL